MKKAYESSPLSFVYYQNIDGRAVPVLASDGFCRNAGKSRETVLNWLRIGMFERMHPDDVGVVSRISDDFLHQRGPYDVVFRCRIGEGPETGLPRYAQLHGLGKWQTMPDGTELAVITYANLSATREATRTELEAYTLLQRDRFYTDGLTELPNINYLHEFGDEKLATIRADGHTPYLIYTDIESMQSYNNQYGFEEGDRLLCLTAEALKSRFPKSLVIRGSDDHFVVVSWQDDPKVLKSRLYEVNTMIRSKAYGNTSGIRSGVCPVADGTELGEALDHARHALRRIENDLNRKVAFFSQEADNAYWQSRYIVENFDRAMEEGWIKVYYQALYRMESGKIAAFEGLARWVDPERGVVSPGDFIPTLLKYHQLYKLDLYMFEQVCREIRLRSEGGLPLMPVSVNFSRQDFDHADVVGEMDRLYEKYELDRYVDKSYFIVEITEQDLAVGAERLRAQLRQIREAGYRLWLDDFGSGYSAINMFSRFEFDLIKYDMDLLRHLDDHGGVNRLILRELVYVSRQLGIHTLIEGVETAEQFAFVKEIGCELAQGFYFQKPESLDQILKRVRGGEAVKACETPQEREELNRKWFQK
ncbi:MAG: GGDEF domain-containing phosphodiesterase [Eubacteriales bacterium]|nr:GGDEF domain-containing phosphodiesterase [Eubacteriales bacterium]